MKNLETEPDLGKKGEKILKKDDLFISITNYL